MKRLMIFVLMIGFIVFVSAQSCPPSIPVTYFGDVLFDNGIISGDFDIVAYVGGNGNLGVVEEGMYEIDVSSCYGGSSGTISFFINGVEANEQIKYYGEEDFGKEIDLDLTINELPPVNNPCGDGKKDPGEVCDGNDFGGLTCSNYGFDSGSLECSDSCINIYIDECYNSQTSNPGNTGGSSNSGSSSGSRGSSSGSGISLINNFDNKNKIEDEDGGEEIVELSDGSQESQNNPESFFSRITGAVVGDGGAKFIIPLVFVVLIAVVAIGIYLKRKN